MAVAERARLFLESRGRRNVYVGCHTGTPDCYDVFLQMNGDGVDTYCILPLVISEGDTSVWKMPAHLTLPDNSGSWTMIGEHDVATRFSTAMGCEPSIGEALGRNLGAVDDKVGVILACHGSALSFSGRTMEYYAGYLRYLGWKVRVAYCGRDSGSMVDSADSLAEEGCGRVRIVPFYISSDSPSFVRSLEVVRIPYVVEDAVADYPEFLEVLDSKVPEDW